MAGFYREINRIFKAGLYKDPQVSYVTSTADLWQNCTGISRIFGIIAVYRWQDLQGDQQNICGRTIHRVATLFFENLLSKFKQVL